MSGWTSSNPPQLIFTSWPAATAACLEQVRRQTRMMGEGWKTHLHTSESEQQSNSRRLAKSLLHCFWTLCILARFGNGLQAFFGLRVGFEAHRSTQNSMRKRAVCADYSQLKPLLLWVSTYFALCWPHLSGSHFQFISCFTGFEIKLNLITALIFITHVFFFQTRESDTLKKVLWDNVGGSLLLVLLPSKIHLFGCCWFLFLYLSFPNKIIRGNCLCAR